MIRFDVEKYLNKYDGDDDLGFKPEYFDTPDTSQYEKREGAIKDIRYRIYMQSTSNKI